MAPRIGVVFAPGGAADLRDLARQRAAGLEVVLLVPNDVHRRHPGLVRLADTLLAGSWVVDSADLPPHDLDGLATFGDELLELTATLAPRLGLAWGVPAEAIDKLSQRRRIAEAGLSQVRASPASDTDELHEAAAALGLPGFVKDRRGRGGRRVHEVDDEADLHVLAAGLGEWAYYETAIPSGPPNSSWWGDMVSVEVAAPWHGEPFPVASFTKLPPHVSAGATSNEPRQLVTTGNLYPWALTGDLAHEALRLAVGAVHALGLRGTLTHVEIMVGADGPDVVEVNCRTGGYLDVVSRAAGGPDLVRTALALALPGPRAHDPVPAEPVAGSGALALGIRVPRPGSIVDEVGSEVGSEVVRARLGAVPGVQVLDLASSDPTAALDGNHVVHALVRATDRRELETRLADLLARVCACFERDGVADLAWMVALQAALPKPRDPDLELKDHT